MFYAVLFSIFVGLYGYVFNARHDLSIDMVRIYNHYEMLRAMNFSEGMPYFVLRGDLSLFTLWLLGRTGMNAQIVGFLVASLSCFSFVYVFDKWMCLLKIRHYGQLFILAIFCFFLTLHPTYISGVRSPIAFSFFLLGFISYFSDKKFVAFFFFLLSVFNHFSMIFSVVLFGVLVCFDTRKTRKISLLFVFCGVLYRPIMNFFLFLLSFGGVIGALLSSKIEYYVFEDLADGEVRIATGSHIWYAQFLAILGVFLLIQLSPHIKRKLMENKYLLKLDTWIWLLIGFVLLNVSNITMIARFSTLIMFFCMLQIISVVGLYKNRFFVKLFQALFFFVALVTCVALIKERMAIPEFQIAYQNVYLLFCNNLFQILNINVDYLDLVEQNLLIDE